MTDEIKRAVASKVHKEYKSFIGNAMKRGARYAIENALMISFYKEIHIYVLNGILSDSQFEEMSQMNEILKTLWGRYVRNSVFSKDTHYLNQLIDFHKSNRARLEESVRRKR
mgnify:CR=1 FL=1